MVAVRNAFVDFVDIMTALSEEVLCPMWHGFRGLSLEDGVSSLKSIYIYIYIYIMFVYSYSYIYIYIYLTILVCVYVYVYMGVDLNLRVRRFI